MEWKYYGKEITEMPDSSIIGFVYMITYMNGKKYIGKKNVFSKRTVPARKDGTIREGAERVYKRVKLTKEEISQLPQSKRFQKSKTMPFDVIKSENKWRSYKGSCEEAKGLEIQEKRILCFCTTNMTLTYMEAETLIDREAIFREDFLNKNILGKFYDNALDGLYVFPEDKEEPNLFTV